MSQICLDTSAYSQMCRGSSEASKAVSAARAVIVPAIVLGELRVGFRLGRQRQANESELSAFLADPIVTVPVVDDEVATLYAEIVVDLRQAGTPLPTNDIWIAAVAARHAATVVTFDQHFGAIGRIGALILQP